MRQNFWMVVLLSVLFHGEVTANSDQLVYWSQKGNLGKVERLLRSRIDPNRPDSKKQLPLHEAARRNHIEVVKMLVKNGAELDKKDKSGATPVYLAAWYSDCTHLESYGFFLEKGAKILENYFADFSQIRSCNPYSILKKALEHGANINDKDSSSLKATPILNRIREADAEGVALLMNYHPDLTIKDSEGKGVHEYLQNLKSSSIGTKEEKSKIESALNPH